MPSDNLNHFRIGVYALIFDDERVLLAHRRDIDWWNLPGGGMEIGETVEEATCREVLSLPIYPELRADQQLRVVATISRFYQSEL